MHGDKRVRIFYDSKHAARVSLGVAHAKRNTTLASNRNELIVRTKGKFDISVHHVFGHASNAGIECDDIAVSFGMKRLHF